MTAALALAVAAPAHARSQPVAACGFSPATFSFNGDPATQARCLLRPFGEGGELDDEQAAPPQLPATLAQLVGQPFAFDRDATRRALSAAGFPADIAGSIGDPISRGGGALNLQARYFVIHDTSTPPLDDFPADIDTNRRINSFAWYRSADPIAHVFVNRRGELDVTQDFSQPLRATKLEHFEYGGDEARGMFLHVELVQPRRDDPGKHVGNRAIAPTPGFTPAQYQRLAQLYVLASARAGVWLVPGFHANIDRWIRDAHDDPQNFSLTEFDAALAALVAAIETPATSLTSATPPSHRR
ncbi:MAG TPA: hypothetical protein VG841_14650 [Caulobacterales bacterium]|nr:hypothetical protein [Caulobacterales bacterium]